MANDIYMATEAPGAPVTAERKVNPNLQDQLEKPYLPRALVAVDPSNPHGTEGHDNRNLSVLQQHASFFDRNKDGIVYPWETYQGLRALGFGIISSLFTGIGINILLTYATQPSWIPSLLLSIHIKNIHKGKHGSDTESFDTEGRFEPSKFDAIFSKYALTYGNALTWQEIRTMLKGNANVFDPIGRIAALMEWKLLFSIAKDENGLLTRDIVRGVFDGSLFEKIERKNKASKGAVLR
ncbi:hypothetical protein LUZ61_006667 [Rhynchospora tenuis]|uniref:Peroxygenase 3 n=1 Tax=Rhynchospora tenuis TaxID=198213 RepID=A0AAD5ZRW8_9POAL|nr:hypothetical protein LUZ61_006667 [Rhynchospora tenuis]